jgi:hypothetical protein
MEEGVLLCVVVGCCGLLWVVVGCCGWVVDLFRLCFNFVLPLFYLCFTFLLPLFYLSFTFLLPFFYLSFAFVLYFICLCRWWGCCGHYIVVSMCVLFEQWVHHFGQPRRQSTCALPVGTARVSITMLFNGVPIYGFIRPYPFFCLLPVFFVAATFSRASLMHGLVTATRIAAACGATQLGR